MTAVPDVPDWLARSGPVVVATIVATVELERALRERGHAPDLAATAVADDLLGGRVVLLPAAAADEPRIALAEPTTEGRLAASLARLDEGPAGSYMAIAGGLAAIRRLVAAAEGGVNVSRPAATPFGPGVLVLGGPLGGRSLILVDGAAVPSPP